MSRYLGLVVLILITSCNSSESDFDATGTFEAQEIIISAESSGSLISFKIEEGQALEAGAMIGSIDSVQWFLKMKQLEAQIETVREKKPNREVQLASIRQQLKTAIKEQDRIQSLYHSEAATGKQLDDINATVDLLTKQLEAQQSSLNITTVSLESETLPLLIQIDQIKNQLEKCHLINPVKGIVLSKYAEEKEFVSVGKPLYRIADLSTVYLRVYLTEKQLSKVKLNQTVNVFTDDGRKSNGKIVWINDKAEFTPKSVQTKDGRSDLVYACKIKVENDGSYKIGMYGEIRF